MSVKARWGRECSDSYCGCHAEFAAEYCGNKTCGFCLSQGWVPSELLNDSKANESAARKMQPIFQGCFNYFPDALLAVAEHSRKANEKHNPGEALHWAKEKSTDHADCAGRHLLDIGPEWDAVDPEFGSLHATALAWRALALLQTVLERKKGK